MIEKSLKDIFKKPNFIGKTMEGTEKHDGCYKC
jgi:hypothetical protein